MSDVQVKSCQECGASIYPEHLTSHKAGYWSGKLVCVHCLAAHRSQQVTIDPEDFAQTSPSAARQVAAAPLPEPSTTDDLLADLDSPAIASTPEQPLVLEGSPSPTKSGFSKNVFTSGPQADDEQFKRNLQHDGRGATRCRIYHAKLNDGALKFMQNQINEWIDAHPDVEVKHATTQVGVVEGKSQEPHLIMTVWY